MNDFKQSLRAVEKINRISTVSQLRRLADKIENGGYISALTRQELDELLAKAIREEDNEIANQRCLEEFKKSLHKFSTSVQQATSQDKSVEEKIAEIRPWIEEDIDK